MLRYVVACSHSLGQLLLPQLPSQSERSPDDFRLGALVASGQQSDQAASLLLEVGAVPRAVVDSEFRDPFTSWRHVSGIP